MGAREEGGGLARPNPPSLTPHAPPFLESATQGKVRQSLSSV